MDAITAAGSFATIVGLLADFTAHRSGRNEAAEFSEFVEWLRFHGHNEVLAAIEANQATTVSVKAALAEGHQQLTQRLQSIERELAILSDRHGPLGNLARAFYPRIAPDILSHVTPGVPRERVRDLLGSAHKVVLDVWWYRCPEALLQIEFYKDSGAQSVALALTNSSPTSGFVIPVSSNVWAC